MEDQNDIHEICRLCCESSLLPSDRACLQDEQEYLLREFFENILRLEYHPEDGLPQNICMSCRTTVIEINNIVEGFRSNDTILRERFCQEIKEEETPEPVEGLVSIEESINDDTDSASEATSINVEYLEQDEQVLKSYLSIKDELTTENHDETILAESLGLLPEENIESDPQSESEKGESLKPAPEIENKPKFRKIHHFKLKTNKAKRGENQTRLPKKRGRKPTKQNINAANRPRLNDYKCYVCKSDSLGSKEALLAHLHSHLDLLPYTCKVCVMESIVITSVTTLNVHKRMHENPVKCNYCDRRYSDKRNVALHVQQFHLGETTPCPYPCDQCEKVCTSKMSLKLHQVMHNKPFKCDRCNKLFSQKSKLRRHIERRHERTQQYECHICHKMLHSLDAVQQHIENMHTEKSLCCSFCSKMFSSRTLLRNHENVHKRNPEYRAPQSWTSYYTPLEGDDEGYSKCNICNLKLKSIVTHLRQVHFPEEFRCKICDAVFKRKEAFDGHVLEHTQGKAFRCPICGREFSERKLLVCHLKTKKHRDHPLAQSLDWLNKRKRQGTGRTSLDNEIDEALESI